MAKGRTARVVLNRRAIEGVRLAFADGVFAVAKTIVKEANPPDATPYGKGLVTNGGALLYVDGKKLDGMGLDGKQPGKPRTAKSGPGTVAIAGFGFPGRFLEFGTVKMAAQPFFTPARDRVLPRATGIIRQASAYRIARLGR